MRKAIFALGLGIAIAGSATVASAQNAQRPDSAHRHGRFEQAGPRGGGLGPGALLKGITLTDAQKTKLQALRKDKAGQPKADRTAQRATMEKMREARQRGDTATANTLMREARSTMQREQEQRVAQIRTILTPDQQKQFDANLAEWKQHMAKRGARGDSALGARRNGGAKRSGPSA